MEPTSVLTLSLTVLVAVLALLLAAQRARGLSRATRAPAADEWRLARLEKNVEQILRRLGLEDAYVPDEVVRDLLRAGKKIEAIRAYRAATGAGLKQAKDAVEALERSLT